MAKTTITTTEEATCSVCGQKTECVKVKTKWLFYRTVYICQSCVSGIFKKFKKGKGYE